jgi:hypothetical protein
LVRAGRDVTRPGAAFGVTARLAGRVPAGLYTALYSRLSTLRQRRGDVIRHRVESRRRAFACRSSARPPWPTFRDHFDNEDPI